MTVLVLNCGSSSVKYRLLEPDGPVLAGGLVERIGEGSQGRWRHSVGDPADGEPDTHEHTGAVPDHRAALEHVLRAFSEHGPDLAGAGLAAVGHRVVHGGERFREPTLVDPDVLAAVEELSVLAPLHNPAGLTGLRVAREVLPDVPHVAVFDTAFHASMPPQAATYALPAAWREQHGVRRYGFHGTSYAYVAKETARLLGRPAEGVNAILLHLGNGASACALAAGRSVDTSMGMTPLQGLVMGTRSGDVDPALPAHLGRVAGLSAEEVDHALNRDSGLLGLTGLSDLRAVQEQAAAGDETCRLALDVYCYRIRHYVGAYYATLGRVDAITFTAGVGENSPQVREHALAGLDRLGIVVDHARNHAPEPGARRISPDGAEVTVLVVPTDEEREIARQTAGLVGDGRG
jgi:acetate kinase